MHGSCPTSPTEHSSSTSTLTSLSCSECHRDRSLGRFCCYTQQIWYGWLSPLYCNHISMPTTQVYGSCRPSATDNLPTGLVQPTPTEHCEDRVLMVLISRQHQVPTDPLVVSTCHLPALCVILASTSTPTCQCGVWTHVVRMVGRCFAALRQIHSISNVPCAWVARGTCH